MAESDRYDRKAHDARMDEQLRHKNRGYGTHGRMIEKELNLTRAEQRGRPEGNGGTGQPAAFPEKP